MTDAIQHDGFRLRRLSAVLQPIHRPPGFHARPVPREERMTAGIRLLLAATALTATLIDPSQPVRFVAATYGALSVYVAYSAILYGATVRRVDFPRALRYSLPWIDVGTYSVLIGLSGGSNSIYFVLFYFGILLASFEWGFGAGVAVTAAAVLLFIVVGYVTRPADPEFDLNRFLLRSATLPVLGYLIAYRGGHELELRRRLSLLRDISALSNPRFGPGHMLARSLDLLRDFFDADLAVALLGDASGHRLHRAVRGTDGKGVEGEPVPALFADGLLSLEPDAIVCFRPGARPSLHATSADGRPMDAAPASRGQCEHIAEMLGVAGFVTVPLRSGRSVNGRLYIGAAAPRFDTRDGDFLLQAADQMMPALAHLDLVARMATRAAQDERQRIALDLHDRIIQPYIGLQIGLAAVEQIASAPSHVGTLPLVRERLEKLADLTTAGLTDLRSYVRGLHTESGAAGGLTESLRRFGVRFHEATGIRITLDMDGNLALDHRLATEVFSMVSEAVSNVHRHTAAPSARIVLRRIGERLVLRIENVRDSGAPDLPFVPRSISQRAAAVNGTVAVEFSAAGDTIVTIEIPL